MEGGAGAAGLVGAGVGGGVEAVVAAPGGGWQVGAWGDGDEGCAAGGVY